MSTSEAKIGYVMSSAADTINVRIDNLKDFESHKANLQVGRYLKIAEGNNDFVIAIIRSLRGTKQVVSEDVQWTFDLECQPLGTLVDGNEFTRGSSLLPVPTEAVFPVGKTTLDLIFAAGAKFDYALAPLAMNKNISLMVNGNGFFGKHVAVVGSTGSGKSCTVARILQDAVGIHEGKNKHAEAQKNAHIVIFDIHAEYARAFQLKTDEKFTLNKLSVETLALPYWLMNAEELESLFIESNEANSHNQVSIFKLAVILNKTKHNPSIKDMTYDCPVYFSIKEVAWYIENMNREVIGRRAGENQPKLFDGTLVASREKSYFDKVHEFVPSSTSIAEKAINGPFNGEFNKFVSRLSTTLSDRRLNFLLQPTKKDGSVFGTTDFEEIMRQFLGYLTKSNVTIIDLSGIPFEVMSITVSLVARLIFDFSFHYSKIRNLDEKLNDIPVMIVCEEAHNYIPKSEIAAYKSSKKSIERIAKEGRKYGLSLMIVSQRPAEVSDTIFAQCSNFISLRLTNSEDQAYVRHLIPNNVSGITDVLPNLADGEAVVVGDAMLMPAIIKMALPDPEPQSESIDVYREWREDWRDISFGNVIKRWQKEITEQVS
jgi:DNA helicase HerA-like ATPase